MADGAPDGSVVVDVSSGVAVGFQSAFFPCYAAGRPRIVTMGACPPLSAASAA